MSHKHMMLMLYAVPVVGAQEQVVFVNRDSLTWPPFNPDFSTGHSRQRWSCSATNIHWFSVKTFAEFCAFSVLNFSFQSNVGVQWEGGVKAINVKF